MQGSLEVEVMDEPDWTEPTLEDVFGDLHDLDGSIQFDDEDDIPDGSDWTKALGRRLYRRTLEAKTFCLLALASA